MGYAEALTTNQMIDRVQRALKRDQKEYVNLDPAAVCDELNAAAREVADNLTGVAMQELRYTVTLTVAQGATSVALPDGTDANKPAVRRLYAAEFLASGQTEPTPLNLADPRNFDYPGRYRCGPTSYDVALEGLTLRWLATSGAPLAGTVTLRYAAGLPLAVASTGAGKPFDLLPVAFSDAIVDLTIARLLPTANAARGTYDARGHATLQRQMGMAQRRGDV